MNFWTGRSPNKHIAYTVKENSRFKEFLTDSPWRNKSLLEAYMFVLSGVSDPSACFVSKKGKAAISAYLRSRNHLIEKFSRQEFLDLRGYGYVILEDRQFFFKDNVVASRWCAFRITISYLQEPIAITDGAIFKRKTA